jgi:hypothetical protein
MPRAWRRRALRWRCGRGRRCWRTMTPSSGGRGRALEQGRGARGSRNRCNGSLQVLVSPLNSGVGIFTELRIASPSRHSPQSHPLYPCFAVLVPEPPASHRPQPNPCSSANTHKSTLTHTDTHTHTLTHTHACTPITTTRSPGDFAAIARIGQDGKMGQPAAIGRFGVGFNAVYHLVGAGD